MRASLIAVAASAALLCVACSDTTDGQATGTPPPTSPSTSQAVPTTSSEPASPMKGKTEFTEQELCDLLTSEEVLQLGGGSEEGKATMNVDEEIPLCQWNDVNSLVITYNPDGQVARLTSGPSIKKSKITVNGMPGVLSDNRESGLCQVGVNLTDHSDLVVGVAALAEDEGTSDACAAAKQMADIVFSKVK